jgi:hypothetical protein
VSVAIQPLNLAAINQNTNPPSNTPSGNSTVSIPNIQQRVGMVSSVDSKGVITYTVTARVAGYY